MSWNQAGGKGAEVAPEKKARLGRWLATTGIMIAVLAGGVVWFWSEGKTADKTERKSWKQRGIELLTRGQGEAAPKVEAPEEETPVKEEPAKPLPPQRVGELRDGYRLLPSGRLHKVVGIITNTPPKISLADKTFEKSANVELGNLLMVEPGDEMLGDSIGMYEGFAEELKEALTEKIEFNKDDTPMQRELKECVIELRQELADRMAAGEDVEQLMEDTRNQLKELSLYREELDEQVRNLTSEDLTEQDYEDLVTAANSMLEERGIKPLEVPKTLRHALRLKRYQEAALEREKANE